MLVTRLSPSHDLKHVVAPHAKQQEIPSRELVTNLQHSFQQEHDLKKRKDILLNLETLKDQFKNSPEYIFLLKTLFDCYVIGSLFEDGKKKIEFLNKAIPISRELLSLVDDREIKRPDILSQHIAVLKTRAMCLEKSEPLKAIEDYKRLIYLNDGEALLKAATLEASQPDRLDDAIADYQRLLQEAVAQKKYELIEEVEDHLLTLRNRRLSKDDEVRAKHIEEAMSVLTKVAEERKRFTEEKTKQEEIARLQKLDATLTELHTGSPFESLYKFAKYIPLEEDEARIRAEIDKCLERLVCTISFEPAAKWLARITDNFFEGDFCVRYIVDQLEKKLHNLIPPSKNSESDFNLHTLYGFLVQSNKLDEMIVQKFIHHLDQMMDYGRSNLHETTLIFLNKIINNHYFYFLCSDNYERIIQLLEKDKFLKHLNLAQDRDRYRDLKELFQIPAGQYPTAVRSRIASILDKCVKTNNTDTKLWASDEKNINHIYQDAIETKNPHIRYALIYLESKTHDLPVAKTDIHLMRLTLMSHHVQVLQHHDPDEKHRSKADNNELNIAMKKFVTSSCQFAAKESLSKQVQDYWQAQAKDSSSENRNLAKQALDASHYYDTVRGKYSSDEIIRQAETHSLLAVHHIAKQHKEHRNFFNRPSAEVQPALCQYARFLVLAAASQPFDEMKTLINEAKDFINSYTGSTSRYQMFALWLKSFIEEKLPQLSLPRDVHPDALILRELRTSGLHEREQLERVYKENVSKSLRIRQARWESALPACNVAPIAITTMENHHPRPPAYAPSSYSASAPLASMLVASTAAAACAGASVSSGSVASYSSRSATPPPSDAETDSLLPTVELTSMAGITPSAPPLSPRRQNP